MTNAELLARISALAEALYSENARALCEGRDPPERTEPAIMREGLAAVAGLVLTEAIIRLERQKPPRQTGPLKQMLAALPEPPEWARRAAR